MVIEEPVRVALFPKAHINLIKVLLALRVVVFSLLNDIRGHTLKISPRFFIGRIVFLRTELRQIHKDNIRVFLVRAVYPSGHNLYLFRLVRRVGNIFTECIDRLDNAVIIGIVGTVMLYQDQIIVAQDKVHLHIFAVDEPLKCGTGNLIVRGGELFPILQHLVYRVELFVVPFVS